MIFCKQRFSALILAGIMAFGVELPSGELLQTEKTIPVEVPAHSRAAGSIPANWKVATVRNSEFICASATENGKPG